MTSKGKIAVAAVAVGMVAIVAGIWMSQQGPAPVLRALLPRANKIVAPPAAELATLSVPESLSDGQISALHDGVRRQAAAIKDEALLQVPWKGDVLSSLFAEAVPTAKAMAKTAPFNSNNEKASHHDNSTTGSAETLKEGANRRADASKAAKSPSKAAGKPFNPYPSGPEPAIPELATGYQAHVSVLAPGRLDWTFVSNHRSLAEGPTSLCGDYDSKSQGYELYVPEDYDPEKSYPMMLYVSPGHGGGWGVWRQVCEKYGVVMAGPHNAGNDVPMARRCRVVLDVLDDVRRRLHIDPDRTYISGMSGGGNACSRIAFALPELFGGNIAICGTWNLRVEPMVRRRMRERLSVAVVTGERDFNGPEMAREFYPDLVAHQVRTRLWLIPGMGHDIPNASKMDEVFQWVEAGLPERRQLAQAVPASRLVAPLSPEAWSRALLMEAGERLQMSPGTTSGLFMLQGIVERWPELPAAKIAEDALAEFDGHAKAHWDQVYRSELLRFRYLQARNFDGILNSPLPQGYPVPRRNLVFIGIDLWDEIHRLAPKNGQIAREAETRLAALKKEKR
jgi:hypothetical protein